MVEQAASAFVAPIHEHSWIGTTAWDDRVRNGNLIFDALACLTPGTYAKGHMAYVPEIAQGLYSLGVGVVFIYRDLRDVLVSTYHHIMNADGDRLKHPEPELYWNMSGKTERMIALIEGVGDYVGIFDRWECYAGWLTVPWICKVRYEDFRANEGASCGRLFRYGVESAAVMAGGGEIRMPPEAYLDVVSHMVKRVKNRKQSTTFRRGKSGGWRKQMPRKVKECFKSNDPGWLVALGYEKDDNW